MKYIFRYTILTNFPHPDNQITPAQLSQALQSLNFSSNHTIPHLQSLSLNCLHTILSKPHQKPISIIQDLLNPETDPSIPHFNPKQLQTIWENQKINIYKSILQQATPSANILKDIEWSVKNIIIKKTQNLHKTNTIITKIHINHLQSLLNKNHQNPLTQNPYPKSSLSITLNKKGVQKMYNSLVQCQNSINQILVLEQ